MAEIGRNVKLYVSDGTSPDTFTLVGAQRTTEFTLNNETVDITNKDSAGFQTLLGGAGNKSVSISCSGVWENTAAQIDVQTAGFNQAIRSFQLRFDGISTILEGEFYVTDFTRGGEFNGEETYSMTLASSGAFNYA